MSIAVSDDVALARRRRVRTLSLRIATSTPLAAIWLLFALANLKQSVSEGRPVGLGTTALELTIAVLFFVRRQAWSTSRAPLAWTATAFGTFGMLAARPAYAPVFGLSFVYLLLQVIAAVAAFWSLGFLGRSFGLVPANRGIQTAGPYSLVRHPLYVCYFLTDLGYVLENPSGRNALILLVVTAWQVIRIRAEEECLGADPSYARYTERVRYRLVPRVW